MAPNTNQHFLHISAHSRITFNPPLRHFIPHSRDAVNWCVINMVSIFGYGANDGTEEDFALMDYKDFNEVAEPKPVLSMHLVL